MVGGRHGGPEAEHASGSVVEADLAQRLGLTCVVKTLSSKGQEIKNRAGDLTGWELESAFGKGKIRGNGQHIIASFSAIIFTFNILWTHFCGNEQVPLHDFSRLRQKILTQF